MERHFGGQDRPAHRREAIDEEGRHWRARCDVRARTRRRSAPSSPARISRKRTNARILWMSRRTALANPSSRRTSGSARSSSKRGLSLQLHQQRVEQREPLGIAVEDRRLGKIEEGARHRQPRRRGRSRAMPIRRRTDRRRSSPTCHVTSLRRHAIGGELACCVPPAGEIIRRFERTTACASGREQLELFGARGDQRPQVDAGRRARPGANRARR